MKARMFLTFLAIALVACASQIVKGPPSQMKEVAPLQKPVVSLVLPR